MPVFLIFLSCLFFTSTIIAAEIIDLGQSPDKKYHLALILNDENGWSAKLRIFNNNKKTEIFDQFEASYMTEGLYGNMSLYWVSDNTFRLNTNDYPAESATFYTAKIQKNRIIKKQNVTHGNKILNKINDYLVSYGEVEGIGSIYLTRVDNGEEMFSASGMIGQEFCPYDYDISLTKDKKVGVFSQSLYTTIQWNKVDSSIRKPFMCFPEDNKKKDREAAENRSLLGIIDTKTKKFIPD